MDDLAYILGMANPEEKINKTEQVNLSELFAEQKDDSAYSFKYGPLEELQRGEIRILYRAAKNAVGVQFTVVLGSQISDIEEREGNQFVAIDRISANEREEIRELLRQKGIRGKIDFL